ncbi:MAG TPA: hypothetical protein DEO32_02170 [Ruminococcaceae bacterium]|nr:hypothetical protein [Oscillospiraceae bacterium]
MKHNRIEKSAELLNTQNAAGVSEEELALINTFTRKPLSAQEVYTFNVTLCDNDVDRDGERFPVESLFELEKLFVGKTGIFDHNPTAKNQTARIYRCGVEAVEGKTTATGDDYFRLKASAYMPRCPENEKLILDIDSGILREVSVGCAVESVKCSICGEEIALCPHTKGESYSGKLCCGELTSPYDAYEFSFVAVPAQKEAGVIKTALGKEVSMEGILKKLGENCRVSLSSAECEKLKDYINSLKQSAKDGVYYRDSLTSEVLRLSAAVNSGISRATMEELTKAMSVAQLCEFKNAYEKKLDESFKPVPQLCKAGKTSVSNGNFTI